MTHPTADLAAYAAALRYDDIPAEVVQRAKDCIADTLACIAFGTTLPWSHIVIDYARANGAGGKSAIFGARGPRVHAPMAALAHGALCHAFELDSLTRPNSVGGACSARLRCWHSPR